MVTVALPQACSLLDNQNGAVKKLLQIRQALSMRRMRVAGWQARAVPALWVWYQTDSDGAAARVAAWTCV